MTKIHLIITARENYAKWACLCIDSLMRRGGVKPTDVIVSIHEMLLSTRAADVLKSFGVTLRVYRHGDVHWGKFILIDRVFKSDPGITEIIQLDCDIVLTEDMDFIKRLQQFDPEALIAGYHAPNCPAGATFKGRANLFHEGFSPTGAIATQGRLSAYLDACFSLSLPSFQEDLESIEWVYGGVILVRRAVTHLPVWGAMVNFSWVCACDETTIILGMVCHHKSTPESPLWRPIPQDYLAHRVNPPVLDLNSGPGMIHFAGDWYRIRNENHNQILIAAFDAL